MLIRVIVSLVLERLFSFPSMSSKSSVRPTQKLSEDEVWLELLEMRALDYTEDGNGRQREMPPDPSL